MNGRYCLIPPTGFRPHFYELERALRNGGKAVVTLPNSFGEIFTSGRRPKDEILGEIESRLTAVQDPRNPVEVKAKLDGLDDVYRATFIIRGDKLVLVQDEGLLKPGEPIWRKLPKLTVPNYYHPFYEYEQTLEEARFRVEEVRSKHLASEAELNDHNASVPEGKKLGTEYVTHAPFVVYVAKR